jgi:undecaprenyl-diphosphatase
MVRARGAASRSPRHAPDARRREAVVAPPGPRAAGSGPIPVRRAVALGLVQGPAELLPVSSSAHLNLIPWLAGWDWARVDPEVRKSFEVMLHAGAAAALLVGQRSVIASELRQFDRRRAAVLALSFVPPAIAGYVLERPIERLLGGPGSTAVGLVAGSVAMVAADRRPEQRGRGAVTPADGLALGIAQAAALSPGVSRNGATLVAARWRRFTREHANLLSRTVALPVIVGASVLKGIRLRHRRNESGLRRSMAAGAAASFASTLASQRLIDLAQRDRALWPYAAYRCALAAIVAVRLAQLGRRGSATEPEPMMVEFSAEASTDGDDPRRAADAVREVHP